MKNPSGIFIHSGENFDSLIMQSISMHEMELYGIKSFGFPCGCMPAIIVACHRRCHVARLKHQSIIIYKENMHVSVSSGIKMKVKLATASPRANLIHTCLIYLNSRVICICCCYYSEFREKFHSKQKTREMI